MIRKYINGFIKIGPWTERINHILPIGTFCQKVAQGYCHYMVQFPACRQILRLIFWKVDNLENLFQLLKEKGRSEKSYLLSWIVQFYTNYSNFYKSWVNCNFKSQPCRKADDWGKAKVKIAVLVLLVMVL